MVCAACVCVPLGVTGVQLDLLQGAQAHRGYLFPQSCSTIGEAEIDHLRVPALNTLTPVVSLAQAVLQAHQVM